MNAKDWVVLGLVVLTALASTVYLFLHPSDTNYATYAGLALTMGGIYHWLFVYDSKHKDADGQQ